MSTRLGPVHLTITDLDRSVAFYQDAIGLRQHRREDGVAALGADSEVVVLHEDTGARPRGRHAGLFHFALLFPDRAELARALWRLVSRQVPLQGASDHGVSEALYLADPDDNGIELYRDRDRSEWPAPAHAGERVGMFNRPLDLEDLLDTVEGEDVGPRAGDGLVMGHMHLHVSELEDAVRFYAEEVALEEMTRYPGAAFMARDGYHHHLGINTWLGEGVPPVPDGAVGLRRWTLVGGDGEPRELTDPSGNRVVVVGS